VVSDKMMNEENLGQMKGVSKHRNENSTFWAHFSTMGRIKLREVKVSLHFVHSRPKEKVLCFQFPALCDKVCQ
jgi:hypothetical protein